MMSVYLWSFLILLGTNNHTLHWGYIHGFNDALPPWTLPEVLSHAIVCTPYFWKTLNSKTCDPRVADEAPWACKIKPQGDAQLLMGWSFSVSRCTCSTVIDCGVSAFPAQTYNISNPNYCMLYQPWGNFCRFLIHTLQPLHYQSALTLSIWTRAAPPTGGTTPLPLTAFPVVSKQAST